MKITQDVCDYVACGVKDVLDMLAGRATWQEILSDYPYLGDENITAALERHYKCATAWKTGSCCLSHGANGIRFCDDQPLHG